MPIDPELMAILACPVSHAPLIEDGDSLVSTDAKTRRRYRIVDDIPNFLVQDSEELDEATWREIMQRHHAEVKS